jgi:hypothetical protein
MVEQHNRSVPELFNDIVAQLSSLFRKEVQLARAEVGEKVSQAGGAAGSIAVGGVLLLGALIMLLHALAALIVYLGLAPGWAYLITGVVVALIGYFVLRGGLSRLKASNLTPQRTVEQLSRDAAVAKEQVR